MSIDVYSRKSSALNLLLWSDVTVMTTLSLSAVFSLWWKSSIALSADHLLSFVLSSQSSESWFDLDLTHTTASQSEDQVESRFLLDVVIRESSSIFELLSSEDKSLLIRGDAFFVLDFSLDVVNGVGGLDVQGDSLTREGLHEDLHTSAESKDKMERGLLLDVVVGEGSAVLELLAGKDESLLVRRDALLILDLGLDVIDGVRGLNIKSDGLARKSLHENLHVFLSG